MPAPAKRRNGAFSTGASCKGRTDRLEAIGPTQVAAWTELRLGEVAAPTVKQELAALRGHLLDELRTHCPLDGLVTSRMVFHELTPAALIEGFRNRVPWTHSNRAEAAITRAIIDKAIGEVMTGEVGKRLQAKGQQLRAGIGRVRIALLRLIAEHDTTARQVPEESWAVSVRTRHQTFDRNPNTRLAYARAAGRFLDWCAARGVERLETIGPMQVAAWTELRLREVSAPTVKQELAALRRLFDWLVVGQVLPHNPSAAVRGPAHSAVAGKTPHPLGGRGANAPSLHCRHDHSRASRTGAHCHNDLHLRAGERGARGRCRGCVP